MHEQRVGRRPAVPPAHAEHAGDRGQVHETAVGHGVPAGIALQLAPQTFEPFAMAQQANVETISHRTHWQAAQVAPGTLDFGQDAGLVPVRSRIGHGGETREAELPSPEAGLAQPTAALLRDHEHVLAPGTDGLQHRPGEHRGGPDAGQGNPVPFHRREPGGERFGAGDRAEQHAVVAPATRLPSEPRRMDVVRTGERPGRPGTKQRAAFPGEYVGDVSSRNSSSTTSAITQVTSSGNRSR